MSFPDSDNLSKSKFRIVYIENCSNISSRKPLFMGTYMHLDEIKERLSQFIPSHPSMTIEYYNKQFGLRNRYLLDEVLPTDLESIYVYLRSKKPMTCHVCEARTAGSVDTGDNHRHM